MHLSIIIPAFNEEKNLKKTIYNFDNYLKKQNFDFEVIIVNDGSHDSTREIAENLSHKFPYLKVINTETNQGKGAAVRAGLMAGVGDYLMFIDADGATDINHLEKVWSLTNNGAEIVIASRSHRDHPGTLQEIKQAWWKRMLGICGNRIIRFLTVKNIWDTQCGFKVFSKKSLDIILPKMMINRWAFDVEMLVIAQNHNLRISVIPVVWKNSEFSRVGIKGYFASLKEVIIIKMNLTKGKYN